MFTRTFVPISGPSQGESIHLAIIPKYASLPQYLSDTQTKQTLITQTYSMMIYIDKQILYHGLEGFGNGSAAAVLPSLERLQVIRECSVTDDIEGGRAFCSGLPKENPAKMEVDGIGSVPARSWVTFVSL